MSVEVKKHTDSTFLVKTSKDQEFTAKPRVYEIIVRFDDNDIKKSNIICKNIETGDILFMESLDKIKVNGNSFETPEALTSELSPLVFNIGGGSGPGASNTDGENEDESNNETPLTKIPSFYEIRQARGNYIGDWIEFYSKGGVQSSDEKLDGNGQLGLGFFKGNDVGFGHVTNHTLETNKRDKTYNVWFGSNSLRKLTTGKYNVTVGYSSLRDLTSGTFNVAIGNNAGLLSNANTHYSLFVGSAAGSNVKSSYGSLFIGPFAGYNYSRNAISPEDLKQIVPVLASDIDEMLSSSNFSGAVVNGDRKELPAVLHSIHMQSAMASNREVDRSAYSIRIGGNYRDGGYVYRDYNNIIIGYELSTHHANSQIVNSMILGNFFKTFSPNYIDNVLAIHQAKTNKVYIQDALIYGKFEERFLTVNGKLILPKKYSPVADETFTEVLLRKENGDVTGMSIIDFIKKYARDISEEINKLNEVAP